MSQTSSSSSSAFGPDLRAALVAMVRKRVPESEVEDIVQATLAEAVESPHAPTESEALRKWIFGVAKNKVVDYHRRAGRETFDLPEVADSPAPHAEADLLRWAERHLPEGEDAQKTLGWMLREGEGEKLESIAASEKVPAPRVRQRVSRLRRHFKDNWRREVALLAAFGVVISIVALLLLKKKEPEIAIEPVDPRAEPMRLEALGKCQAHDYKACLDELDAAKRLDPAGDTRPEVQRARRDAEKALEPAPPTTTLPPVPTSSAAPLEKAPPVPTSSAAPYDTASPAPFDTSAPPAPTAVPTPVPTSSFAPPTPTKPGPSKASKTSSIDFGSDSTTSDTPAPQFAESKQAALPTQAPAQITPPTKKGATKKPAAPNAFGSGSNTK
jgi:DNA-directed RNA polymerase specialized sigma24 family protein